jgi:hypothetical protein
MQYETAEEYFTRKLAAVRSFTPMLWYLIFGMSAVRLFAPHVRLFAVVT